MKRNTQTRRVRGALSLIRRSQITPALAFCLAVFMAYLSIPAPPASAHKEQIHGLASMLALEYLKSRALSDQDAQDAYDFFSTWGPAVTRDVAHGANSMVMRAVLGIAPDATFEWDSAPRRQEPGLSGVPLFGGYDEFPERNGALLAYATAAVDQYSDIWGDARNPFQVVVDRVDEAGGIVGGIWDWFTEKVFKNKLGKTFGCKKGRGFFGKLGELSCKVAELLVRIIAAIAAPVVGALLGLTDWIFGDAINESVAEDAVSGCDWNFFGQQVIDSIVKPYTDPNKTYPYPPIPQSVVDALSNDESFYRSLGVDFDSCDQFEEVLGSLTNFRAYGTPDGEPYLLLSIRARISDAIRACNAETYQGKSGIAACITTRLSALRRHFGAAEPWALSAEGVKREVPGETWQRWSLQNHFTSMGHFIDLLSPKEGSSVYDNIWEKSASAKSMIRPPDEEGQVHAWDGYSLFDGTKFEPALDRLSRLGLNPGGFDEQLRKNSELFKLSLASPSNYLFLRRRVCEGTGRAGLKTHDRLGDYCNAGIPTRFYRGRLTDIIHPPADIAALDGWTTWSRSEFLPTMKADGTNSSFQFYDSFLPILAAQAAAGGTVQPRVLCPSPISCMGYDQVYAGHLQGLGRSDAIDAMRIRGLGLALHMIQDMTIPHHLAPTTGYGHAEYEEFVRRYLWPSQGNQFRVVDLQLEDKRVSVPSVTRGNPANYESHASFWGDLDPSELTSEDLFDRIVERAEEEGFWGQVDDALSQLRKDMEEMMDGTGCHGFSIRSLARAVAFRTLISLQEVGEGMHDLSPSDQKVAFWLMSAASLEKKAISLGGTVDGAPTWKNMVDLTAPFLVAGTAILLIEAARTAKAGPAVVDSLTCDRPASDGGQGNISPHGGLDCNEVRSTNIRRCFGIEPMNLARDCDEYKGIGNFDSCHENASNTDFCGRTATDLAACSCQAVGDTRLDTVTGVWVANCVQEAGMLNDVDNLESAGEIDGPTYLYLRDPVGSGLVDTDGDGIPDVSDRCPTQSISSQAKYRETELSTKVCWLRKSQAGECRYGCATN